MKKVIDLRPKVVDLRKVKVGTIVITSKGFKFKLVSRKKGKESWLDCTSKLIWHDLEDKTYNHYEAVEKFCNHLPTIEEFLKAEEHGFREVCPNMKGYWFWSASLVSYDTEFARAFCGSSGDGFTGRSFYGSTRCVGRQVARRDVLGV